MIIIDNSLFSFANQLDNGILVTSFFNDLNDSFLLNLINYLQYYILNAYDVRIINKENFKFHEIKKEIINKN